MKLSGRDTDLLDRIAGLGLWYFAEVPHDTQVWQQRPVIGLPLLVGPRPPPDACPPPGRRARAHHGRPAGGPVAYAVLAPPDH